MATARPQSELFIPNQFTISPSKAEETNLFSEAYLAEAVARLKSQDLHRPRLTRQFTGSRLRISTGRLGTGQFYGKQRVHSPRVRALNVQAARFNSRYSRSSLTGASGSHIETNYEKSGTRIGDDSEAQHSAESKTARMHADRVSVMNVDAGVSQEIIEFQDLADQTKVSLLTEVNNLTKDGANAMESPAILREEILNPGDPGMEKSESTSERPVSIAKTPTKMYRDDYEPTVRDANNAQMRLGTVLASESRIETIPSSMTLSQNRASDITTLPLRSGSVLTVVHPEQTAWQRSIYIQGPIKLPRSNAIARKESFASMASMYALQATERDWDGRNSTVFRKSTEDEIVDNTIEFFESLGVRPEFHESDMSSIKCRVGETESESEDRQETPSTAELPVIEESIHRVPSNSSSSVISLEEDASWLHNKNQTAREATSPSSANGPKRFNSLSKKRKYKRNALNRLTSII